MTDIITAILAIRPTAQVSVKDEDVDQITWHEGEPISTYDIINKQNELKIEYDNNVYQRDRAVEYPSIVDQLDDLYHNGLDGWKATIKSVKDKYPKG